ncbi:MAG: YggS family pyridoxal phosphate-dependent enzyme [Chloroflexi bacterium CFX4]|nr:YggS family pyridoxal phosphate-dependent enzyme [Chloroflexi bacterium CFX4]MDL1922088.1 YggS family pyridoxal phosphate-dependent enzyme [Chloroflexi bacterium CFX3]
MMSALAERLEAVRLEIAAACHRANRSTDSVTLIAVSKTHPSSVIQEAISYGQLDFGESRVEEALRKISEIGGAATWHMIGHVQSRKAKDVIALFDCVHSLDSARLAERYARLLAEGVRDSRPFRALIEVNISGELTKSGVQAANWQDNRAVRETLWAEVRQMVGLPRVEVEGLMTIAPIVSDPEQARPYFASLRALRDALAEDFPQATWDCLSMGMTDDYPIAIEEGATHIRVGRAIFGERS